MHAVQLGLNTNHKYQHGLDWMPMYNDERRLSAESTSTGLAVSFSAGFQVRSTARRETAHQGVCNTPEYGWVGSRAGGGIEKNTSGPGDGK